jgi:hypothetical protein
MNSEDRFKAIAELGFTPRQARFLVFVLRHAGVCLLRQYSTFAGIVHGQKTRTFFEKLVTRQYATAYTCRHNRGRLYHVHHSSLYRAIDEPNNAHRRPLAAGGVAERLMTLDAVLANPELAWLTSRAEKVTHFTQAASAVLVDALPRCTSNGASSVENAFPDRLPIGIDSNGRAVFLYLVLPSIGDGLRAFLRRHRALLERLPSWTLRLVVPRAIGDAYVRYQAVVGEELDTPLHPRNIDELKWYFEQLRVTTDPSSRLGDDRFARAHRAFERPRFQTLYRHWRREGDRALEHASSTAISEALATGAGRVESVVLPYRYDHLSPLVAVIGSRARAARDTENAPFDSEPPRWSAVDPCPTGASVCEELRRGAEVGALETIQRSVDLHETEPSGLHQHA